MMRGGAEPWFQKITTHHSCTVVCLALLPTASRVSFAITKCKLSDNSLDLLNAIFVPFQ